MKLVKAKPNSVKQLYEFGPFRLDRSEHVLFREGAPIPLTPKAIETLQVLVENSGHLVSKDELMNAVWPDTAVEENNLTQSISTLRKALGPDCPFIETVPRQGYRFLARVQEREEQIPTLVVREKTRSVITIEEEAAALAEPSPALPVTTGQVLPAAAPARRLQALIWVLPLLLTVGLGVYATRVLWSGRSSERRAEELGIPSLARGKYVTVIPLKALGDQTSLHYVSEGLSEALTARLFRIKDLHVISALTGERESLEKSVESVGRQLGVNVIVAGTVQEIGDQIQVVASVEDIADKRTMWTGEYSSSRRELLVLQDRMLAGITEGLGLRLSSDDLARNFVHPTESSEAYDLYLKGRDALRGYRNTKEIESAISFHQMALKKDPAFALALAGLADAYLEMYSETKENIWNEKALHSAGDALRLGPNLAEAHFAMGSVHYSKGEEEKAIEELSKGLKLDSNSDEGYRRLGSAYYAHGQVPESLQAYQRAIKISPYYVGNYQMLGDAYLDLGQYAKALDTYAHITDIEPSHPLGYQDQAAVYLKQSRWQDSIPLLQKAIALQPDAPTYSNLGTAYFFLKRYDQAVPMFERAVQLNPDEQFDVGNLADAYRWSGHPQKANTTYRRAIELCYKELEVNPQNSRVMGSLALYYAKSGEAQKGLQFARRARSVDPSTVDLIYIEGVVQALAGHRTEALKCLAEAFQKGYSPDEARNDPELATLHSQEGFDKLTQKMTAKNR